MTREQQRLLDEYRRRFREISSRLAGGDADETRLRADAQRLAWGFAPWGDVRAMRATAFLREWDHQRVTVH